MTTPRELSTIKLDHMANIATAAQEARAEAKRLLAFAEEQEERIREAMGDAEQATIFGVPYYTWQQKQAWALARFAADHPHIAKNYERTVEKVELDREALLREQGDLLANYQVREFRRVSRAAA